MKPRNHVTPMYGETIEQARERDRQLDSTVTMLKLMGISLMGALMLYLFLFSTPSHAQSEEVYETCNDIASLTQIMAESASEFDNKEDFLSFGRWAADESGADEKSLVSLMEIVWQFRYEETPESMARITFRVCIQNASNL